MKYFFALIMILSVLLSACAATPEAPPTSTPKPTAAYPHGIFNGCVYYNDEIVPGFFNIYDENENYIKDVEGGGGDCTTTMLTPGSYWVEAAYYKGADCSEGCFTDEGYTFIEISDGETIDMDFELQKPD